MTPEEASEWELEHFGMTVGPVRRHEPEWRDWVHLPQEELFKENFLKSLLTWLESCQPEQGENFLKWWVMDSSPLPEETRELFLKSLESCPEHIRELYLKSPSIWRQVCPEEQRENFLKWVDSEQRGKLLKWLKWLAAKKDGLTPGMRRLVGDLLACRAGLRSYNETLAGILQEQKQRLLEWLGAKIVALPPEKKQQVEDLAERCNGDALKFLRRVRDIVFPTRRRGRQKGPTPAELAERRVTLCACIGYCLEHRRCLDRRCGATEVHEALAKRFGVSTWAIKKRLGVSPKALMKRFRESNQYRIGLEMQADPDRPPSFNALRAAIPIFVRLVLLSDWDPALGPNPYDTPKSEPEESLSERAFNFLDEDEICRAQHAGENDPARQAALDLAQQYRVTQDAIRMRRYRYKRIPIPF